MARPILVILGLCCVLTPPLAAQPAEAGESAQGPAGEALGPAAGASTLDALYERREICGFDALIRRDFQTQQPALLARVLLQLEADLDEVSSLLPAPALDALRATTIWVELQGAVVEGGMSGRGMCCHWSAEWLESAGLPREKAGGVEIVNPRDFLEWRGSQPYMTLHELAHAYHRMIGPDLPEIVETFRLAVDAGLYERVGRNSLPPGEAVPAYAATNHHEYFAELSEAYFGLNDFEPYTRAQLRAHDPDGFDMIERLWGMSAREIAERVAAAGMVEDQ